VDNVAFKAVPDISSMKSSESAKKYLRPRLKVLKGLVSLKKGKISQSLARKG
jgi:hypothetical protein